MKIGVFVGSLRKGSYNRQIANTLLHLAPSSLHMRVVEIGDLPLYNQDEDSSPPKQWQRFRDEVKALDACLFITPEYNRSVPAVLKNAIDVGSRPYGQSVWNEKPAAIISSSIGAIGGFGANHHLRQSLVFLNMPCLQQPEMYLSFVDKLFDADGKLVNEDTRVFLKRFLETFEAWVKTNKK